MAISAMPNFKIVRFEIGSNTEFGFSRSHKIHWETNLHKIYGVQSTCVINFKSIDNLEWLKNHQAVFIFLLLFMLDHCFNY